jgi:hypothetical protein
MHRRCMIRARVVDEVGVIERELAGAHLHEPK